MALPIKPKIAAEQIIFERPGISSPQFDIFKMILNIKTQTSFTIKLL